MLPPPMSTRISLLSKTGTACSTPRWMRRASSRPEITSTVTPTSAAALMKSSALAASRTAEVATARSGAFLLRASWAIRASAATPRSMASGSSCFMSPPPWPRRTVTFSRSITSKRAPCLIFAITRWKLLVPTSIAASTGSVTEPSSQPVRTKPQALRDKRCASAKLMSLSTLGSAGSCSTRSPTMLRWTSSDPPAIRYPGAPRRCSPQA